MFSLIRSLGLLIPFFVLGAHAQTPPANDNFSDRITLSGDNPEFPGTLYGATMEPTEENGIDISGFSSVWWSWTPGITGYAAITLLGPFQGSQGQSELEIGDSTTLDTFRGSVIAVTLMRPETYVGFPIVAGHNYTLRLIGEYFAPATNQFKVQTSPQIVILQQPQDQSVKSGGTAFFTVLTAPRAYVRWQFNGVFITNYLGIFPDGPAEGGALSVANINATNVGSYRAVIGVDAPFIYSASAQLTLSSPDVGSTIQLDSKATSTNISLNIIGEANPNMMYLVQSSEDLNQWLIWEYGYGVPGNVSHQFWTNSFSGSRFYRAIRFGDFREQCVANLRKIAYAKFRWAIEYVKADGSFTESTAVEAYLGGQSPRCPAGGTYTYNSVGTPPVCSLAVLGHTL